MRFLSNDGIVRLLRSCSVLFLLLSAAAASGQAYDPLAPAAQDGGASIDLAVTDATRQREIPIRVYLPAEQKPAPVVLFSHGLGGSREGSAYLGKHWSTRGYVAVFLQHPGSDTSVWRNVPLGQRMAAMKKAADLQNFMLRVKDVPAVLDALQQWNGQPGQKLCGRLDLSRVGMSGHSFGAVTTQAVSGERFPRGASFTDPRIKAAIAFSPSVPERGLSAVQAFGGVAIPWMLMTGTKDVAVIVDTTVSARLAVYPALPPGDKYELVLYNAEHSAFADRALPSDRQRRNPNHHRAILALSTAFWDAMLKQDPAAKAWLDGNGPGSVLEPDDRWQHK